MQTCDTLLHAGVLLTQDDDRRVLENAALAIDGGRIVALGCGRDVTAAWQAREILDLSGMLVMPGLVNAHTHAAMTFLRGLADDMPLMDWLQQKIFPVEQGQTPDLVRLGSLLGFAEMLRTGTTACVDMYIFEAAVLEAADRAGLRCLAGEGVFNFPSACCPDADAALACTREMAQRWAGHDRLHVAVMPHSVYTTTAAQLTACRELADELGLPLHIHLAETRQETALSLQQHGLRPVAHADRLGLLRPGIILAHVVDVDADEMALLARRGVSVVHNPSSNMKLASGVAPVPTMLDAGVRLALGSDGAASNNRLNMFTEMGRAALLHKAAGDPETMPARTVLDMATRGGAAGPGQRRRRPCRGPSRGLHRAGPFRAQHAAAVQCGLPRRLRGHRHGSGPDHGGGRGPVPRRPLQPLRLRGPVCGSARDAPLRPAPSGPARNGGLKPQPLRPACRECPGRQQGAAPGGDPVHGGT